MIHVILSFLADIAWLIENYPAISLADIVPFDNTPTSLQRATYNLVLFIFGD